MTAAEVGKVLAALAVAVAVGLVLGFACSLGSALILHPSVCQPDRYGEPVCVWDGTNRTGERP